MSTAVSVGCDGKRNPSKPGRLANNVGKMISSKNQKTAYNKEDTTEQEEGGSPSNTINAKNPKLSLLDQAKYKVDFSCAGYNNKLLASKPKAKIT